MDLGLSKKTAVITGGSVGIGLAIAEGLAAEGVDIVIAARHAERVEAEARRIHDDWGVRTLGVACDVGTSEGTEALPGQQLGAEAAQQVAPPRGIVGHVCAIR